MNDKNIIIENDSILKPKDIINLHITYERDLTLKELSEIISLLNSAINDFNRENGITSNIILGKEYASTISCVKSGSIVLEIVANIAISVACGVFANYIYDRVKTVGCKKGKKEEIQDFKYPINIAVNGDNNTITINVENGNLNIH